MSWAVFISHERAERGEIKGIVSLDGLEVLSGDAYGVDGRGMGKWECYSG